MIVAHAANRSLRRPDWRRALRRLGRFIRTDGQHPPLVVGLAAGQDRILDLPLRLQQAFHVGR